MLPDKATFLNRIVPKKKGKGTSNEEKLIEADAADHSNRDDKAKKNELKTNEIAVYEEPVVGNWTRVVPGSNKTTPKKKGKRVSNVVKILEADVAAHCNPDHKAKKRDPTFCLPLNWALKLAKKKRKERSVEEKIPEANSDNHLKSFQQKNYLQADTGADDMDHDLCVGKEIVRRPSNNIDLVVPERKADEKTSGKATKKKKRKSKVQKNDENMDVTVSLNGEKENSMNEVQEENVISVFSFFFHQVVGGMLVYRLGQRLEPPGINLFM